MLPAIILGSYLKVCVSIMKIKRVLTDAVSLFLQLESKNFSFQCELKFFFFFGQFFPFGSPQ